VVGRGRASLWTDYDTCATLLAHHILTLATSNQAERPFYDVPLEKFEAGMVEMDRQIGRESTEVEPEVLDALDPGQYDVNEALVRPRVVGRVDMEQQVGRESLEIEAEPLCNPEV
jgi:hypothetical protein